MYLHHLCLSLLAIVGFMQGIRTAKSVAGRLKGRNIIQKLVELMAAATCIGVLSLIADTLGHLANRNLCIFGLANCLFTLLLYVCTASTLHLHFRSSNSKQEKNVEDDWKSGPYFFGLLVLILVSYECFNDHFMANLNTSLEAIVAKHNVVWTVLLYSTGCLLGLTARYYIKQRLDGIRWLLLSAIGAAFIYQFLFFIRYNFFDTDDLLIQRSAQLTLMIISFHLLYLLVKTQTEPQPPDALS